MIIWFIFFFIIFLYVLQTIKTPLSSFQKENFATQNSLNIPISNQNIPMPFQQAGEFELINNAKEVEMDDLQPAGGSLTSKKMVDSIFNSKYKRVPTFGLVIPKKQSSTIKKNKSAVKNLHPTLPPPKGSPGNKQIKKIITVEDLQNDSNTFETEEEYIYNQKEKWEIPDIKKKGKDIENVCILDHVHLENNGKRKRSEWREFCNYGITNYPDPKTLKPFEKQLFKLNYSNSFTLQDYINWLWLFKDDDSGLTYIHARNLKKLKKGLFIEPAIVPQLNEKPPIWDSDYYQKLYSIAKDAPVNRPPMTYHLEQASFLEDEYPDFLQSYSDFDPIASRARDLNTDDILNKKDATDLDNYIYGVLSIENRDHQARNVDYIL